MFLFLNKRQSCLDFWRLGSISSLTCFGDECYTLVRKQQSLLTSGIKGESKKVFETQERERVALTSLSQEAVFLVLGWKQRCWTIFFKYSTYKQTCYTLFEVLLLILTHIYTHKHMQQHITQMYPHTEMRCANKPDVKYAICECMKWLIASCTFSSCAKLLTGNGLRVIT